MAARVSAAAVSSAAGAALAAEEVTPMLGARFPVEVVGGVPVVAAPQEIDITNADGLRSALLEVAAHGHGTLVADMTRTRFCDSSGLHALLAAHKRAQAQGGELLLVIPSAAVLRVLAITCIDRMIPNFTSLEEALAQRPPTGRTAIGEPTPRLRAANRTGSPCSTAPADLTNKPADHAALRERGPACAGRAAPPAEPGADAGPAAPQAPP